MLKLVGQWRRSTGRTAAGLLLPALLATCTSPEAPTPTGDVAVVVNVESGRVPVVAVPQGQVLSEADLLPRFVWSHAAAPDTSVVYLSTQTGDANTVELIALDLMTRRIRWRETWSAILARSLVGPVFTQLPFALTTDPSGTHLYVADASKGSIHGVLVLDLATRTPVDFLPRLVIGLFGLAVAQPTAEFPNGVVLAAATQDPNATPSVSSLFLIDPATRELIDSIPNLTPLVDRRGGSIDRLVVAPGGREVFGIGSGYLVKVDLPTRTVLARTTTTIFAGGLAVAPDGASIFVADQGDNRDSPGSGTIFRYDANLQSLPPIPLPTNLPRDPVLVSHAVAVSGNSRTLYVTAGTGSIGPLFGSQPARLLIVDLNSGAVKVVPLGDWNPQSVFVVHGPGGAP